MQYSTRTKQLQHLLNAFGYSIDVDGYAGKDTDNAYNKATVAYPQFDAILMQLPTITKKAKHRLNSRSLKRLKGVHKDIVRVVKLASTFIPPEYEMFVVDGVRSKKQQKKNVKQGYSSTDNTYHFYGLAVDLVLMRNGKILWSGKKYYKLIYKCIVKAEKQLGIDVLDSAMFDLHWKTLIDYPHYQMHGRYVPNRNPRKYYAKKKYIGFA